LDLVGSLEPFMSGSLGTDLALIANTFGIGQTSATMARLTGVQAWTLSRARTGRVGADTAAHIAVLAAFTFELEKYLAQKGRSSSTSMQRWLLSGKLRGDDRPPIDALSDPKTALTALGEIRAARRALERP
jgi:hypothetical protein